MREFAASTSFLAGEILAGLIKHAETQPETDKVELDWIRTSLGLVKDNCEKAGLPVSLNVLNVIIDLVSGKPPTIYALYKSQLFATKETIFAELRTILFFRVDVQYQKYFSEKYLFGKAVEATFPAASLDIEEAGKCLALGRPTASVYHMVRVMEVGLKALAKPLGIPYAPSWESYIRQIETKIGEKPKRKGVKWKRDEPFFRDLLGALQSIKIAWRNPTMHIVRHYNQDEAEDIFRAVRTFMKRLSERFSQDASAKPAS